METFEEFLKDIHAGSYTGTDDDMPDSFETWLAYQDTDDIINYADAYGVKCHDIGARQAGKE